MGSIGIARRNLTTLPSADCDNPARPPSAAAFPDTRRRPHFGLNLVRQRRVLVSVNRLAHCPQGVGQIPFLVPPNLVARAKGTAIGRQNRQYGEGHDQLHRKSIPASLLPFHIGHSPASPRPVASTLLNGHREDSPAWQAPPPTASSSRSLRLMEIKLPIPYHPPKKVKRRYCAPAPETPLAPGCMAQTHRLRPHRCRMSCSLVTRTPSQPVNDRHAAASFRRTRAGSNLICKGATEYTSDPPSN